MRLLSASLSLSLLSLTALAEPFQERIRPLLEKYCLDCHEGAKGKGEVDLAPFETAEAMWQNPKLWERVLVQLQDKVMPPAKRTQLSQEERVEVIGWLQEALQKPDPAQLPRDPGPMLARRLSRLEYDLTTRDLLGVDLRPAKDFPPDAGGGAGFDNTAATLFVPTLLLEKLLAAADALVQAAPASAIFRHSVESVGGEAPAAEKNLRDFARRAFRRPPTPEALGRLLTIYQAARTRGEAYEPAVRLAAKAVLISPQFIFRLEPGAAAVTGDQRIDDYSLASRLSYFLWSSMPDEALFQLAEQGRLHQPEVLAGEVRRMLADKKAEALAESFAGQWLRVKEVQDAVNPARDRFPQFTKELREAFYLEPIAFFHALATEDRPITDCLDADYTFANEVLAKFYGLPAMTGSTLRRVPLTDRNRGGVLGMGGVLAITSYPRRTSPVLRGKWVMEEILGTPPPPPPPNVNTESVERHAKGKSFRQALEIHRDNPKCAGCHARMDPLGFGLENFGVIGEWRTVAEKEPVDASGQMVSGETFVGPQQMKQLLLGKKDDFTRNLAEKMLAYALGRGLEAADWWPVQQIARATAEDGYKLQTLILQVVQSYPFQYRRPLPVQAQAEPH